MYIYKRREERRQTVKKGEGGESGEALQRFARERKEAEEAANGHALSKRRHLSVTPPLPPSSFPLVHQHRPRLRHLKHRPGIPVSPGSGERGFYRKLPPNPMSPYLTSCSAAQLMLLSPFNAGYALPHSLTPPKSTRRHCRMRHCSDGSLGHRLGDMCGFLRMHSVAGANRSRACPRCLLASKSYAGFHGWPFSEVTSTRSFTYAALASCELMPLQLFHASHLARASTCTAHGWAPFTSPSVPCLYRE